MSDFRQTAGNTADTKKTRAGGRPQNARQAAQDAATNRGKDGASQPGQGGKRSQAEKATNQAASGRQNLTQQSKSRGQQPPANREEPGERRKKQWYPAGEGGATTKAMQQQMMSAMPQGQGGRQNRRFPGQTQADSSESESDRHHSHNLRGSSRLHVDPSLNADGLLGMSPEDHAIHQQNQATALLMQQMGLGLAQNTEKQWTCYLQQQKMQMGNQLRLFALDMFKIMSKNQKKNLEKKAKIYLDNCMKDQKRLQQLRVPGTMSEHAPVSLGPPSFLDSPVDFEFEADPKKYIDEVQKSLSKNQEVSDNFQRFIQMMFEDTEQEQVYTNFITQNPEVHQYYMGLAIQYNHFGEQGDYERQEAIGTEIFNLIMPHAQQVDSRLLHWIPKVVLDQFDIIYESDGFHIKDWRQLDDDDASNPGSGGMNSSSHNEQSSCDSSLPIAKSSSQSSHSHHHADSMPSGSNATSLASGNRDSIGSDDEGAEDSLSDDSKQNCSSENNEQTEPRRGGTVTKQQNELNGSPSLAKKQKSFLLMFNQMHGNKKVINRYELKTVDNFFRSVKDEKDWDAFCRLFYGYFEGIYSLSDFFKLYDEKFYAKVKPEIREEVVKLLQTRDQSRRAQSNLLKPWNDHENQTFEKIPDSSYFKIDDDFPIPTCSAKMIDEVYHKNINDRYLSLAIGTENFKFRFRNQNEENVYKAEDNLFVCETQIDNIKRSYRIVSQILVEFNAMSEAEQASFKFPTHRLNPHRFYWDRKLRQTINEQYLREGRTIKQKELIALRKLLNDRLEYQKNQKNQQINDIKEQFKKNFTRSLDHKSFQYRAEPMKKLMSKTIQVQKIKQLQEETLLSHIVRKDRQDNHLSVLYGSGEIPDKSFYRFYNTFGKDFGKFFDESRLKQLEKSPDHPIDLNFLDKVSEETLQRHQAKCPQARFIMNDQRTFEIVVKLVIRQIKIQGSNQPANQGKRDKHEVIDALRFILNKFLMVQNFDEIEEHSEILQPLTQEHAEILMNSAQYYQMKYEGTLEPMCELFPIEGLSLTNQPSLAQSPLLHPRSDSLQKNGDGPESEEDASWFRLQELKERGQEEQASSDENEPHNSNSKVSEGSQAQSHQGSGQNQAQSQGDLSANENQRQGSKGDQLKEEDVHKFKPLKLEDQVRQQNSGFQRPSNGSKASKSTAPLSDAETLQLFEEEMEQSMFVPQFDTSEYNKHLQERHPSASATQQYKLYYCPLNVFLFMMYFYSIYERILKARELVAVKVEQDFNDDFSKNEWSAKFAKKKQTLVDERFQYLVKAILTTMSHASIMDTSKYEDMARELLGNEAYLLFLVDKLIKNCTQQLNHFLVDQSCQVSQKLYLDFEDQKVKRESAYLVNFYEEANRISVSNSTNQQGGRHTSTGAVAGNTAGNRDNQNPPMNQQAFRLMYSPKSCILTAHFICFNPFHLTDQNRRASAHPINALSNQNGGVNQQEYLSFLKKYTIEKRRLTYLNFLEQGRQEQEKPPSQQAEPRPIFSNKATECSQPVFLNRNLRKMKQIRDAAFNDSVHQSNGLIARMIPLSQNLYFEVKTEDFMHYRRAAKAKPKEAAVTKGKESRSKKLLGKRNQPALSSQESASTDQQKHLRHQDFVKQLQYRSIMNKRFKALQEGSAQEMGGGPGSGLPRQLPGTVNCKMDPEEQPVDGKASQNGGAASPGALQKQQALAENPI